MTIPGAMIHFSVIAIRVKAEGLREIAICKTFGD